VVGTVVLIGLYMALSTRARARQNVQQQQQSAAGGGTAMHPRRRRSQRQQQGRGRQKRSGHRPLHDDDADDDVESGGGGGGGTPGASAPAEAPARVGTLSATWTTSEKRAYGVCVGAFVCCCCVWLAIGMPLLMVGIFSRWPSHGYNHYYDDVIDPGFSYNYYDYDDDYRSMPPPPPSYTPPPPTYRRPDGPGADFGPSWTHLPPPPPPPPSALTASMEDVADRAAANERAHVLRRAQRYDALLQFAREWALWDTSNAYVYELVAVAAAHGGKLASGAPRTAAERDRLVVRALTSVAEIAPKDASQLNRAGYVALAVGLQREHGHAFATPNATAAISTPGDAAAARAFYAWAVRLFTDALAQRDDNVNTYRGLALAHTAAGAYAAAADVLHDALGHKFNPRYGDVRLVLREEVAYVLREWRRAAPTDAVAEAKRAALEQRDNAPLSLIEAQRARITLSWATDANDVDLHVVDPFGNECYYGNPRVRASDLHLYSDQTQGLGPEVTVAGAGAPSGEYHVGVKYYNAGPMGVSQGVLTVYEPAPLRIVPFSLRPTDRDVLPMLRVRVGAAGRATTPPTSPPPFNFELPPATTAPPPPPASTAQPGFGR